MISLILLFLLLLAIATGHVIVLVATITAGIAASLAFDWIILRYRRFSIRDLLTFTLFVAISAWLVGSLLR